MPPYYQNEFHVNARGFKLDVDYKENVGLQKEDSTLVFFIRAEKGNVKSVELAIREALEKVSL